MDKNSIIAVPFANCVFFLFSDCRGYKDRKDVSKLKAIADKVETKMIYFLQQVSDMFEGASCDKQHLRF